MLLQLCLSSACLLSFDFSQGDALRNPLEGHPKLAKMEEAIVAHFQACEQEGKETRIMVFSSVRDGY